MLCYCKRVWVSVCVSKFCYCCCCCLQIQLVYGLNYAKNVLNHLSLSSLPSSSTSVLPAVLFGVVGSNQYFTVHVCVQISMLKNLWALLHICTIYSYSCAQKERTSHTLQLSLSQIARFPNTHFICSFALFRSVSLRCVYSYLGWHKFYSFASYAKNKNKTERSGKNEDA